VRAQRAAFLKAGLEPELWLHGKLVELDVLANPGPWLWQSIPEEEEICFETPDGFGTPTEHEAMLLWLGFLVQYAGAAWELFGLAGGEIKLLAFIRRRAATNFATLDEARHAAIAVGQRYGMVDAA
jgi:hypothetical protein